MKFLYIIVLLFFCTYYSYAEEKNLDNKTTVSDNKTLKQKKQHKLNIKEKLVEDQYINDRNSFMKKFGFESDASLNFNLNFDDNQTEYIENTKKSFKRHPINMNNNINYSNIWEKDKMYIEAELGGGVHFNNVLYVNKALLSEDFDYFGYGSIHLKFAGGHAFSPEFYIEETGDFRFTRSNLNFGKVKPSYNLYYAKIPLGFKIPFFKWDSEFIIDGSYSSIYQNYKVKSDVIVNNKVAKAGDYINSASSLWNVRVYLSNPVVRKSSIIEYSYFGLYYQEHILPKTATRGENYLDYHDLFVSTRNRSGGIFYDLKKNVYKGLLVGVNVNLGYAESEVSNGGSHFDAKFDNIHGLLDIGVKASIGYAYVWKKAGVGLRFEAGAGYSTNIDFIFGKDKNLYRFGTEGNLNYFAELNILFGY